MNDDELDLDAVMTRYRDACERWRNDVVRASSDDVPDLVAALAEERRASADMYAKWMACFDAARAARAALAEAHRTLADIEEAFNNSSLFAADGPYIEDAWALRAKVLAIGEQR